MKASRLVLLISVVPVAVLPAAASFPELRLRELVADTDLVLVGTAGAGVPRLLPTGMIVTDTPLHDVHEVYRSARAVWQGSDRYVVTQAGGSLGPVGCTVSGVPDLRTGERYLLLLRDDGGRPATPIVGGEQGMFRLVPDLAGNARVVTAADRPLYAIDGDGRILAGHRPVPEPPTVGTVRVAPTAAAGQGSARTRVADRVAGLAAAMKLEELLPHLVAALAAPEPRLRYDGRGNYLVEDGSSVRAEALPQTRPAGPRRQLQRAEGADRVLGGPLGACGYFNLYLVMEQVPTGWWSYAINNDSMWVWNRFMDVYQYTPDDGSFGDNGDNEFCGWVDDPTLQSVYGFTWGGAYAMTITWYYTGSPCGELLQADVLWNPAYNWTSSFTVALGNPNVFLLRPVDMHEIGHTWGEQRGGSGWGYAETLDYDLLSVMHRYYHDRVEDGWGIHAADAYLIRQMYSNQTGVINITDVGVESYFAQNGLNNATTDRASYIPGDPIVVRDITVENMSNAVVNDLRLRLYLSTDRSLGGGDLPIGNYWYWTTFNAESYWTGDITTTVPAAASPGNYYVLAQVTVNGFGNDQFSWNNVTSLYQRIAVASGQVVADFSGTPLTGQAPLTVAFTDLSIGSPTTWLWDFGDGGTSASANPSHTYTGGGRFTVSLTASNTQGSDTETKIDYVLVLASEEIVTGAGPDAANAPLVKTWDHATPPGPVGSWSAYGAPQYGVNVGMAGIEGSGVAEVLTGPGPGAIYGPQVRAFAPTGTAIAKVNFYAYGTLRYGVHAGGGNVDGDGHEEILTSPGPGAVFGPHVRGWNYDGVALSTMGKISFYAYSTLKYGARVAGGDTDADAFAEIVTGAGAGAVFGPHVRGFNFDNATIGTNAINLYAFTAGQYGAAVAAGDTDGDGRDTVVAAHGPDPASDGEVRGYDQGPPVVLAWFVPAFPALGGAEPASGDLDRDGTDEVVVGEGWGAANVSTVNGWEIVGATGTAIPGLSFESYAGWSYGAKVAVGDTGTP